MQPSATMLWKP